MKRLLSARILSFVLLSSSLLGFAFTATDAHANAVPDRSEDPNAVALADRPLYAEGRVLVQLTEQAIAQPNFRVAVDASGVRTGLASLDRVAQDIQATTNLERAYIEVANRLLDEQLGISRWYMLEFSAAVTVRDALDRLGSDRNVNVATPDYIAYTNAVPNDPKHAMNWGHNNTGQLLSYCWGCGGHPSGSPVGTPGFDTNAQAAWDASQGYGSSGVVIAILDSGVAAGHPDLNQVAGYDYGDNDSNPDDNSSQPGHGTACAGVAAGIANNGVGVAGIAGGCSIMPLKVADSGGSLFFSYIQNGLYHAADNGADIASMSFGAAISSDPATDTALSYAASNGVTLLAATGNENSSSISYPANNANVIAVGAASPCGERKRSSSSSSEVNPGVSTDPNGYTCDGERWWGSNYGSTTQNASNAVDVIAPTILPTTDILGSGGYDPSNYSDWFNGTSCATPYAAGVAALVLSANPSYTPADVRNALRTTAQDVTSVESGTGWDRYTGYGMVDADAAVGGGGGPGPQDYATLPYSTGFESASLDEFWTTAVSSASYGRVQVTTANGPHSGSRHLTMDVNTNGNYSQQEAHLHLDLSGETQVDLSFWWKEFSDETHSQDGVYFSDNGGSSFVKVQDLANGSATWQQFNLDLDALAASAGLSLSSTFVVKFQQYDNYAITTDGMAFDDVSVTAGGGGGPTGDYATLPYTTGFEAGSLDQYWESFSTGNGRVRVLSSNSPYAGSYHLTMDNSTSGSYSQNEAWLRLDLSGESQVDFSFRWKEFGDETHSQDGIYFSDDDGASFTKVQNLNGSSYSNNSWQFFDLDLDALASSNGVSLSSTFVIKFQQYDNYPIATDGFAFDEISVTAGSGGGGPTYITAESEDNGSSGSADGPVGSGVNVAGTISSSADDDWYYFDVASSGTINISVAIGSSADLDWFLYNAGLTEVARGYTVSNPEAGSYNASPGRYYLRVDGYQGATSAYTLSVTGGGVARFPEAGAPGSAKVPLQFALNQNAPNPFVSSTLIRYQLAKETHVQVVIYDVQGRRVRDLVDQRMKAGAYATTWDGRDDRNHSQAAGIYFYVMKAGDFTERRKMSLVR